MSCCGGGLSAVQVQAQVMARSAAGVAAAALVRIRYTGGERRVRPYVIEGKVYFFGDTERRREGVVPARVAWQFLEPGGRFYGAFEAVIGDAGGEVSADGSTAVAADTIAADDTGARRGKRGTAT